MYSKHLILTTAVYCLVFFSGCGTIGARAMTKNPPPFAGLRADFEAFGDILTNKQQIEPLWYWLGLPLVSVIILADVPVSAAFDVLCLPADLKSQREEAVESGADGE